MYKLLRATEINVGYSTAEYQCTSLEHAESIATRREQKRPKPKPAARPAPARPAAKRLSYLEQREWEGMEAAILAAEAARDACEAATHDPAVASDASAVAERYRALEDASAAVDRLYARWAELDAKRGA